ncbi:MAG: hypothetical protein LCI02_19180 [Proteobacteria bacterium]|nr:hypothetical protein [Pseudomonadota bacterium]
MRRPLAIAVAFVSILARAENAEPSLCSPAERVAFSCLLRNEKIVSLCTSPEFNETAGYLQYRYGRIDHVELEHPRTKSGTQRRFELETHRPHGIEYESVNFSIGKFSYSVIRVVSTEPDVPSWAGVTATDRRDAGGTKVTTLKCRRSLLPGMTNLGGVPPAKEQPR